jgi:16S rRNA (cytidine1402-2'-O)-methyltransferase
MAKLTLLTLPIGNPQDITLRAFEALKEASFLLAEDTRELVKLLRHYGIETQSKTLDSFHDHSLDKLDTLVGKIKRGIPMTLVSEAGSPIISDPAFPLVRACLEQGIEVATLPGVSSVLVALELSGLPPHPFHFFGFVPREQEKRREIFDECTHLKGTCIFFESPHRLEKTLELLCAEYPRVQLALARELTKNYETVYRFQAGELSQQEIRYQGEFVLCCDFSEQGGQESSREIQLRKMANELLEQGAKPKLLSKLLSELTGEPAKELYKRLTN